MGSAVSARLVERGIDVITLLAGRSRTSNERAERSGMRPVSEAEIANARFILSIVPPSEALGLAERLAPVLLAARAKPLYIDCNAVSSATVSRIGTVITATGAPFADAGIIGGPPKDGYDGPSIYVCGVAPDKIVPLSEGGLKMRHLDGPVGAASALKMSYASITKGLTGIATASILAASRYGAADALHAELTASQKAILATITRAVPDMFQKAYRFVGEMEEIGAHSERSSTAAIYGGLAKLYQEIADDLDGPKRDIAALEAFFKAE
jgi:3-hydroxyisobutyrate dehydrogenase-like beta-hydroxyacid dehydrogenase